MIVREMVRLGFLGKLACLTVVGAATTAGEERGQPAPAIPHYSTCLWSSRTQGLDPGN